MKSFSFIEAPICIGSPTHGSDRAYSFLKERIRRIFDGAELVDYHGRLEFGEEPVRFPKLKKPRTVFGINESLMKTVAERLKAGRTPVLIGGDHSVAMASVCALSEHYKSDDIAVIYIDGHADINTEKTTQSGFIHGMPLAVAMGLCDRELSLGDKKQHLMGENLYILGARSIDEGEYPIISANGVKLYTPGELMSDCKGIVKQIADAVRGRHIHISFDVDCMNGGDFGSTGYVMPGGLPYETALSLVEELVGELDISSFDFVEYNPTLDKSGEDGEKLLNIISLIKNA